MRKKALVAGLFGALAVHAIWNAVLALAMAGDLAPYAAINLIIFPFEFAAIFVVFQMSLGLEQRQLLRELSEEARRGNIPPEHVAILASYRKRRRGGWLPGHVDQEQYVADTTLLAMRLHQLRYATPEWEDVYTDDAARLRAQIASALKEPGS